jgi:hypothetical protein
MFLQAESLFDSFSMKGNIPSELPHRKLGWGDFELGSHRFEFVQQGALIAPGVGEQNDAESLFFVRRHDPD